LALIFFSFVCDDPRPPASSAFYRRPLFRRSAPITPQTAKPDASFRE
jgi:hypothetical protein